MYLFSHFNVWQYSSWSPLWYTVANIWNYVFSLIVQRHSHAPSTHHILLYISRYMRTPVGGIASVYQGTPLYTVVSIFSMKCLGWKYLYTTSSEGMYSTNNFTWQTASMLRVSAEIDMGTQTNSLKTWKSELCIFRLMNRPRLDFYGCIL